MKYLSVCSGIEAASQAWHPLGWEPVAFSEIEKFPCAVLKHHYPHVPNLGDMTKFKDWPDYEFDLLVGGTPCQSFSVSGLRQGLADPRGNLMLTYLAIAGRYRPQWLVWENVPGVLSSDKGRAFGSLVKGMEELGYHAAWRVLNAQYVRVDGYGRAVPQRRRRVFVVGYLGDWRRAASVLFDAESMSGNPAPSRKAWQSPSGTISARPTGGGGLGMGFEVDGGLLEFGGNNQSGSIGVSTALNSHGGPHGRQDFESETFLVHPIAFSAKDSGGDSGEISPTLRAGGFTNSHENGGVMPAVAFSIMPMNSGKDYKARETEVAQPLMAGHGGGDQGGDYLVRTFAMQGTMIDRADNAGPNGPGYTEDGSAFTMTANDKHAVAQSFIGGFNGSMTGGDGPSPTLQASGGLDERGLRNPVVLSTSRAVRRLMPVECERLQGFPDGYTDVPYRNKNWTPDGPRYKSLGNSMAVNAMRWIGRRIEMVDMWADELKAAE